MLLDADVQAGLVVDRTGALRGMIRLPEVAAWMRRRGVEAADAAERDAADGGADAAEVASRVAATVASKPDESAEAGEDRR